MERPALIAELDRALSSLRLIQSFELPVDTGHLSLEQANRTPQLRLCTTVSEVIPALQDIREALYAQYPLLPPEVIGRIFRLVAQDDRSFSLHRITHVCRRWRHLAISDPSLWTNIRLNDNAMGVDYATTLLQRSESLPLSVDFECAWYRTNSIRRFACVVMTHYQRIRRLRLSTVPVVPALNRILALYSACSWDALESLFVNTWNVDFVWKTAPRLRFLSITSLDTEQTSPSSFCFTTLRSLRVGGRGNIDLAGWTDALSQMPRLEEFYLDIWTPHTEHAFDSFGIRPDVQRSGTVALNSLRRLTLGLWSVQVVELLVRLTYRKDVLVTLLLPANIQADRFQVLFQTVLHTTRRKIGLDDGAHIQRCQVITGLGRDHTDIEMTLFPSQSSPPFLRLRFDTDSGYSTTESSFYALVLPYLDNDGVEYLELPLEARHFDAFVRTPTIENAPFMPNVRQLKVPRIELDDIETLSMRLNGPEQMVFPKLETLIVDPLIPRRRKSSKAGRKVEVSEAQWAAMTAGLVAALELRRARGFPLREVVLGPHAQSAELLEHLSRSLPELCVKLGTESEST